MRISQTPKNNQRQSWNHRHPEEDQEAEVAQHHRLGAGPRKQSVHEWRRQKYHSNRLQNNNQYQEDSRFDDYEERNRYDGNGRQQRQEAPYEYDYGWNKEEGMDYQEERQPGGASGRYYKSNSGVQVSIPTRSLADEALASPQESQISRTLPPPYHPNTSNVNNNRVQLNCHGASPSYPQNVSQKKPQQQTMIVRGENKALAPAIAKDFANFLQSPCEKLNSVMSPNNNNNNNNKGANQQRIWDLLDPKDDVGGEIMTPRGIKKKDAQERQLREQKALEDAYRDLMLIPPYSKNYQQSKENKAFENAYRDLMLMSPNNNNKGPYTTLQKLPRIKQNTNVPATAQVQGKMSNNRKPSTRIRHVSGNEGGSSHTSSTLSTLDSAGGQSAQWTSRESSSIPVPHNTITQYKRRVQFSKSVDPFLHQRDSTEIPGEEVVIQTRSTSSSSSARKSQESDTLNSTMQSFHSYSSRSGGSVDIGDVEKLRQELWAAKLNHTFPKTSVEVKSGTEASDMTMLEKVMKNQGLSVCQSEPAQPGCSVGLGQINPPIQQPVSSEVGDMTLLEKVMKNQVIGLGPNGSTLTVKKEETEDEQVNQEKQWTENKLVSVDDVPQFFVPTTANSDVAGTNEPTLPISSTYHMYVAYSRFGDKAKEVIQLCEHSSIPSPNYKGGEVLVKVRSSSISIADCDVRRGERPEMELSPYIIPGSAFCGQIPKSEKKTAFSKIVPGDIVMSLQRSGSNARYVCAPKDQLVKLPPKTNPDEALCLAESYLTAFQTLHLGQKSSIRYSDSSLKGRSVLIMVGGYSSLVRAFIEVANAGGVDCCYVITKQRDFPTISKFRAIPLSRDPQQWLTLIGRQIDLIITCNSHKLFTETITREHMKALTNEGEVVIIGQPGIYNALPFQENTNGNVSKLICKTNRIAFQDRSHSYNVFDAWDKDLKESKRDLEHLLSLLKNHRVRPQILQRIPLSKVASAQNIVYSKRLPGYFVCLPWTDENKTEEPTFEC